MRLLSATCVLIAALAWPAGAGELTGYPRFASLKADTVNLRTGPGQRYPVEWVYKRRGLPVEVTVAFDKWRRVRDHEGTQGWIHQALLTERRTVLIVGAERILRAAPEADAPAVALLRPGVVAALGACRGAWCEIEVRGTAGWLRRQHMWGVYPDEQLR